jgi:putative phosphoribosyl transferase
VDQVQRRYADRTAAGHVLAEHLGEFRGRRDVIVLGLPRGGVVVAAPVARHLGAPLDVVVVRKLGVPGQPELAMGAVAAVGDDIEIFRNDYVCRRAGIGDEEFDRVRDREAQELRRRRTEWGPQRSAPVTDRVAILTDDGLATGSTMRAAVAAVRRRRPRAIVVAVPTGAPDVAAALARDVDRLVCPVRPSRFRAVGEAYVDFSQTADAEVARLLSQRSGQEAADPPE